MFYFVTSWENKIYIYIYIQNEQNNSVKNSILNACRSHSTGRNTTIKVPAAKQTENNKNEAIQNEIEILKKKIESMIKDHSVVSKFPPGKNYFHTHHQNNHLKKQQLKPHRKKKNGNVASGDGGQKQHQIKQVIEYI